MQHKSHPMQLERTLVSTLLQQQDENITCPQQFRAGRKEFYAQVAQEQQKPLKDILVVLLVDCLIFLFLVTGILTITLYIIRFIAGV